MTFYEWFRDQVKHVADLAHEKGKPFIIGEFGGKQSRGARDGFENWRGCAWFDTPQESMAALQIAEAVLAAVNGGADAIAYWNFVDFPDDYDPAGKTAYKWGTFRWDNKTFQRRTMYYSIGLLTRFFRGPGSIHAVTAPEGVRAAAVRGSKGGLFTVALLNRRAEAVKLAVKGATLDDEVRWDAYTFDPKQAEGYVKEGPLLNAKNTLQKYGPGEVSVPAQSMVVMVQQPEQRDAPR